MCSRIQNVAKLANQVFSLIGKDKSFSENLQKLKCLVSQLHKGDLNLNVSQLERGSGGGGLWSREAPISFVEIFENEVFTLGIFILRNGARIPLHDHPGMHGIIKVIHGTVSVQSYSSVVIGYGHETLKGGTSKPITVPVKKNPVLLVDEFSEPCLLEPDEGNYHEIKAVGNGSAAFVDILAPPYDKNGGRDCRFYREKDPRSFAYLRMATGLSHSSSSTSSGCQSGLVDAVLVQCDIPMDYWTNSILYAGPEVRL